MSISTSKTQNKPDNIIGTWYSSTKEGKVLIYKRGNNYFGKLIDLKAAHDNLGNPLLDSNNPDVSKRKLPLIGIVFLNNFVYDLKKNKWKGKLYDYDGSSGNTYDVYITIDPKGIMNIRGFWGYSWFGLNKGLYLTKVE